MLTLYVVVSVGAVGVATCSIFADPEPPKVNEYSLSDKVAQKTKAAARNAIKSRPCNSKHTGLEPSGKRETYPKSLLTKSRGHLGMTV